MKTKIFRIFVLFFAIFFPMTFMLTSCSGGSGKSAYELAVKQGFKGSEEEWLASLKGKSAYELALEHGFRGTEEEWLASLSGENGRDGTSAVQDSYEAFLKAKELGEIDEDMKYLDFLREVFAQSDKYQSQKITRNISSVVEIHCFASSIKNTVATSGSGIVYKIDETGAAYIVTNYHVVYYAATHQPFEYYSVTLCAETVDYDAKLVGASRTYDLAVLKVESRAFLDSNPTPVEMGGEASLGQLCYAIGNTENLGITVSQGVVSVESEMITMTIGNIKGTYREIRHDAYISHGSSGGALFDRDGRLIGITNGGKEGTSMNYAIPANIVKAVADNIIGNPLASKEGILVYTVGIERSLTAVQRLTIYDSKTGELVTKEQIILDNIDETSPLFGQDVLAGDELVKLTYNGTVFDTTENFALKSYVLSELLLSAKEGDELTFVFMRDGVANTVKITLSKDYSLDTDYDELQILP